MHQMSVSALAAPGPIAADRPIRRVVLIGSFPPRRCGIATFTSDVQEALKAASPDLDCRVVAMSDGDGAYADGPEVMAQVRQNRLADYLEAARDINAARPDAVCVQHEFGLFGGPAGEHLMLMLDAVTAPVTTTLHTVLTDPDPDQRRVFERLIRRSARIIVMAERGRQILEETWKVPTAKILVTPHGAPDRPLVDTAAPKARLGLGGREVMLTFGLLSPGKGLESMIRALPDIVRARPEALYVILGATHPHLIAREGEAYREGLFALARELGVGDHVRFHNRYVDTPLLLDWLAAADLYVTPYLNEAQITSGTLSYAVALGKAVISTPYWHAQELLADGRGVLTPFNDPAALAAAAIDLLADPARLADLQRRAWAAGRETLWSRLAERYLDVFAAVRDARPAFLAVANDEARSFAPAALPRPALGGVRRMTDGVGILQHSLYSVPDRNHGYCVDDNARALLLMHRLRGAGVRTAETDALAETYAAFVHHAWNDGAGRFRNFMGYDRTWLEEVGSDDSVARAWWSVAVTAAEAGSPALRQWAHKLRERIAPHLDSFTALRTYAFLVLGLSSLVRAEPGLARERDLLERLAGGLAGVLGGREADDWCWFEDGLTPTGPNLNRGAESVLSFQLATCAMHALDRIARPGSRPADKAHIEGQIADRCQSSSTAACDSLRTRPASSFGRSTSLQMPDR